jgi:hypothetical protein
LGPEPRRSLPDWACGTPCGQPGAWACSQAMGQVFKKFRRLQNLAKVKQTGKRPGFMLRDLAAGPLYGMEVAPLTPARLRPLRTKAAKLRRVSVQAGGPGLVWCLDSPGADPVVYHAWGILSRYCREWFLHESRRRRAARTSRCRLCAMRLRWPDGCWPGPTFCRTAWAVKWTSCMLRRLSCSICSRGEQGRGEWARRLSQGVWSR